MLNLQKIILANVYIFYDKTIQTIYVKYEHYKEHKDIKHVINKPDRGHTEIVFCDDSLVAKHLCYVIINQT